VNKSKVVLRIGQTCVIIATLFGLHPFMGLVSIPLSVIGMMIIWRSALVPHRSKLLWTFVPLVAISVIWVLVLIITSYLE